MHRPGVYQLAFVGLLVVGLLIVGLKVVSRDARSTVADGSDPIDVVKDGGGSGGLQIDYPLSGAVFPADIAPATVIWKDPARSDTWRVRVGYLEQRPFVEVYVTSEKWKPSREHWAAILRAARKRPVTMSVVGLEGGQPRDPPSAAEVSFGASEDPVGAPIFFREVPLPFDHANRYPEKIRYRLGHISEWPEPVTLLENLPLCGNCHSFSQDGRVLGMDVDYANDKGSYVISEVEERTELLPAKIISWSDADRGGDTLTFGLLSQVSPDGRTVVSTIRDRSIFVGIEENLAYSQLFFPIKGILAYYDRASASFAPLPGADDPTYVQSNPTWSPDGKTLLFARAVAQHLQQAENEKSAVLPRHLAAEFLDGRRGFKYDLYKLPFNRGKGGVAVPLAGASHNGMSNYFAKVTPDGKWVVFAQAANFMLLQPDSQLYIVPFAGGTARRMTCNTEAMNSWHSFSPNGRWMVFSSKARGALTQLWLTHLDEEGQDTPPVLLEHLSTPELAANIPEFVSLASSGLRELVDRFSDGGNYHYRVGKNLIRYGDLVGALAVLDRAAITQPDNVEVLLERGALRFRMRQTELSLRDFATAAAKFPDDYRGPYNLGLAREALGELADARQALTRAAALNPRNAEAWRKLVDIGVRLNDPSGARRDLNAAIAYHPSDPVLRSLQRSLEGASE